MLNKPEVATGQSELTLSVVLKLDLGGYWVGCEEGLGVRGRCQDSQSRGHAAVLSHS